MSPFNNVMELFKLLPKINCRACNETTCLAFASKVFLGQKTLELCPHIDSDTIADDHTTAPTTPSVDEQREERLNLLKARVASVGLSAAADRVGGVFENNKLTLRIFGKPLRVDKEGNLSSDIHMNPWITSTALGYIFACKGEKLTGQWVPLRELKGGREKNGLFVQRSEVPFKALADRYTGLFEELIELFNGETMEGQFQSDISLVLWPLPRLPILVCYWKPEEGMDSDLHLFFDSSADMNAGIDLVYTVATGIVVMFEKIARRHWSI